MASDAPNYFALRDWFRDPGRKTAALAFSEGADRVAATAFEDAAPLTWKPGPPPLDVPGEYKLVVQTRNDAKPYRCWVIQHEGMSSMGDSVLWHFGPIPSPPNGETE
jgi:hypothetical protein